jgi:muramoyltetrapeptide carboxypeptidase LdcA involved in peptidoglycan recycling
VRAVLATVGGEDQITVVPHLDPALLRADPKPFLGYSDNTNLLHWMWTHGVAGFYGGSTQVHLGPRPGPGRGAPAVAARGPAHRGAARAGRARRVGRRRQDWDDPAALTEYGQREPTDPWSWSGPARSVTGPTWGGCVEVLQWVLAAGRLHGDPDRLQGGVLLLETSEELIPARELGWILRSLGERGLLAAVDAVLLARPPTSDREVRPPAAVRASRRAEQRDVAVEVVQRYNPDAVMVVGVPFGHTRPQWILPYGGQVTVDGASRRIWADYS